MGACCARMTVPLAELVELAAAVIAAGIVTGLLAGLFGIGGGAVIVPVLFELFRMYQVPEEDHPPDRLALLPGASGARPCGS